MASWVKANVSYSRVLQKIQPLEEEQDKLKKSLAKVTSKMSELGSALEKVDDRVARLRKTFEQTTTEAAKLKIELEKAEETMQAAQNLVSKLEHEYRRWDEQCIELQRQLDQLPNLCILSAAFVTYLSSSSEDVRLNYINTWLVKLGLDKFDFQKFMCTENELLTWKSEGLPSDQLSIENSIVIKKSLDSVLLIDPSSRATEWLKNHLSKQKLEVINQQVSYPVPMR